MNWLNWSKSEDSGESPANFTPRAQQVLALSRTEAARMRHHFIGTEHLLLGLIALGQGCAVNVLSKLGVKLDNVRLEVEKQVGTGPDQEVLGVIRYTPRVKKALALAAKEARTLKHTYVGTEHLLLGLLREGDGVAARILLNLGVDLDQTRQEILRELDPSLRDDRPAGSLATPPAPEQPKPPPEAIDTSRRYDVYCAEAGQNLVIHRNVLFKARRKLLSPRPHDVTSEFLELERADGQTVFVSLFSVRKFCEPGAEPGGETLPPTGNAER